MELNPNNPIVQQARGQWHKIAAMIMVKLGVTEVEIGVDDFIHMPPEGLNIVLDARGEIATGKVKVRIVGNAEAQSLARQAGGRPIDS